AHYNVALEMCGEQDTRLKNQILLQQGLAYFRLSDWENARTCIEGCLNDKQNLSKLDQAMANYGLGNIHFELGEYETTCEFYEAALSVANGLGAKQLMANIFNNMGAIENIRGHRMRAIALYSKSVPIFKSLSDNFGLARVYNNIGMTHADENNWQHANEFYGQSLMFSDVMGLVPLKSITFLNRAAALTHLKKFNEAREYNFKALRLLEHLKDELGLAEYHKIQGIIEREQKNWQEAGEHLQTALAKYKATKNKLGYAESQEQLARLAKAMNNQEEAISWFEKALASFKKLGLKERPKIIESQLRKFESPERKVTEVNCNEEVVQ
ncbi:tetratricopeptide repeat protein, partial [candidate division KSB1 bacterium]|nr:tetratricopeptide repeat protein [candidate division KSB1 bacterium]